MVSTRHHPSEFPAPDESPVKRTTRSSKASTPAPASSDDTGSPAPSFPSSSTSRPRARSVTTTWSHTPSTLALGWLAVSLPLVLWDTGYVLGRPHTMPGGRWHAPLWTPYALYGSVDLNYGWPAVEKNNGFTGAQAWLNVVETAMYLAYLALAFVYGHAEPDARGRGAPAAWLGRRKIVGREAAVALLIAYSATVMTVSKTLLYLMHEVCSDFAQIRHNDTWSLIVLWVLPNGPWLVVPSYLMYVFGSEIVQGLEIAGGLPHRKTE